LCKTADGDEERLNVLTLFPVLQKHNTSDTVRQRTNKADGLSRLGRGWRPHPPVKAARRRTARDAHSHAKASTTVSQEIRQALSKHRANSRN